MSDWIEQCFTSPPTQYRLYGRQFLQVKRPNQQYQSTGETNSTQRNVTISTLRQGHIDGDGAQFSPSCM